MAAPATPSVNPIALNPGEGEALWFFGALVIVKASSQTTAGRVTVIEHLVPQGAGPPLHVHHREDEWFYVIEGELTFWVGGKIIKAPEGSFVYGPRDIPHTFTVTSSQARSIVVTEPAGVENARLLRRYFYEALDHGRAYYLYGAPGTQKTYILQHLIAELNRSEIAKNGEGRPESLLRLCSSGNPLAGSDEAGGRELRGNRNGHGRPDSAQSSFRSQPAQGAVGL